MEEGKISNNNLKGKRAKPPEDISIDKRHIQYANSISLAVNPNEAHIIFQLNAPEGTPLSGSQVILPTPMAKSLAAMLWLGVKKAEEEVGREISIPFDVEKVWAQIKKAKTAQAGMAKGE